MTLITPSSCLQNLSAEVDNKALFDTFSQFGKILSSKIATGPGGESKGHGFVQYEEESAATAAIETVNGKELAGQTVFVGPFKRREDRDTGTDKFTNLYVKNLDESVTEQTLQEVFGEFGTLSSAVIMKEDGGKSKGFGFVNFVNSDDAHSAVEKLNGHKHGETEWEVTKAQKKAEREAELKAKFDKVSSHHGRAVAAHTFALGMWLARHCHSDRLLAKSSWQLQVCTIPDCSPVLSIQYQHLQLSISLLQHIHSITCQDHFNERGLAAFESSFHCVTVV